MNVLGPVISQQVLSALSPPQTTGRPTGALQQSTARREQQKTKDARRLLTLIPSLYGLYKAGKIGANQLVKIANSFGIQGEDKPTPLTQEATAIVSSDVAGGEAQPAVEETQEQEAIDPNRILKGLGDVELSALSPGQQGRANTLIGMIDNLLQKEDRTKDEEKRLAILRRNLDNVIKGKGLREQETQRFEKEYGVQEEEQQARDIADTPKTEEGIASGDVVNFKTGRKLAERDGQPLQARVVKVEDDAVVVEVDGKRRRLKKSQVQKLDKLKSAPIDDYVYDKNSGNLFVKFRTGNKPIYGYPNVSEDDFKKFAGGRATAKTRGEFKGRRWWKGKNPSLGAAFFQYIRPIEDYSFLGNNADFKDAIFKFLNLGEENE